MDDAELLNALGAMTRPRPDWQQSAACRGINPDVFHPDKDDTRGQKAAKAICHGCDAQVDCLRYAINAREDRGIWGGLSTRERGTLVATGAIVRLIPGRRPNPINHGTAYGYRVHIRRGETPCATCKQAESLYKAPWREERSRRRAEARKNAS